MLCDHQQPGRDIPELRDDKKAKPAGQSRENRQNPVESPWLRSAKTPSDDAL